MASSIELGSQALAASQDFKRVSTDGPHGSIRRLPDFSLPPSMDWGNDEKQKAGQAAYDADTVDTLDVVGTMDDDDGTDAPESSGEESESLQSEQDDDLSVPVKIVPEGLQLDQYDFLKVATPELPLYVCLAPSSETLPCESSPTKSPLGVRLMTASSPVGPNHNNEKLADACICGRIFAAEANFCQICGKSRPKVFVDHDVFTDQKENQETWADGEVSVDCGEIFSMLSYAETVNEITTFTISGIPHTCLTEQFREIVLNGFKGAIDFFYTPCDKKTGIHMNLAVINLVDASHAQALRWALTYSFPECEMVPAQVQGYKACTAFWGSAGDLNDPSSQIKRQFQKTKMCSFFLKGKCLRGENCVYAHSRTELQQNPNLTKTRLCSNFLRQKCFDPDCKYAHGQDELRSTEGVYKTVLCRWSTTGYCKSGAACRFAHAPEELRPSA